MGFSRAGDIYETIRGRICLLQYEPGMVLREEDMASEFGVSRTLIRQALQRLQLEGLIESRKRIGTVVTGLSREVTKEMYDIRTNLMDYVAIESNIQFSDEDIKKMEKLLPRMEDMEQNNDIEEYWIINQELFHILMSVLQNKSLYSLMQMLFHLTARNWGFIYPKMWAEACELLVQEVRQEIAFMRAGNRRGVFLTRKCFILRSYDSCEKTLKNAMDTDKVEHIVNTDYTFDFGGIGIKNTRPKWPKPGEEGKGCV